MDRPLGLATALIKVLIIYVSRTGHRVPRHGAFGPSRRRPARLVHRRHATGQKIRTSTSTAASTVRLRG